MCPRHSDPLVRLRRVDPAYDREVTSAIAERRLDQCSCGDPVCAARQAKAAQGYRYRKGSWETADHRFQLTWHSTRGCPSPSWPEGELELIDTNPPPGREAVRWCSTLKEARAAIRSRILGGGWW